ncbi:MAG: response regulator [Spirochaetales bacterium]|uniref:Response regulator n=1 Tax=Candidatus Thalassospirochaeta sargassi TaxID=3119039 RepID=A0AAJ1IB40_9SPIO|nr:response regulator [Spirochaetales bacterium]
MKLIIADDEHRVCQLIANILPWEKYGIEIAGTAYNALEAYSLIKELKPDIVITDIRMPGYDGITLIEKSRDIDPDVSFIIVSGYRDFEYAQRALKFGAEDYLLKPVSKDELEQIILKVIEKKEAKKEKHEQENNLQRELIQTREILKKKLASEIADKGFRIDPADLPLFGDRYSVFFNNHHFQVIIFQVDHSKSDQEIESVKAVDTILQKTESAVSSYIAEHVYEMLCEYRDFSLVFILNVKSSSGLSFRDLEHLHELATQKVSEYGDWRITLCPGKAVSKIEHLHQSYDEAEFARKDRILRGFGKILEKRLVPSADEELPLFNMKDLENKIKSAVDSGAASDIQNIFLSAVIPPGFSRKILNPETVFRLFRFTAESFIKQFQIISADDIDTDALLVDTERAISSSGSIDRLSSQLAELYTATMKALLSSKRVKDYKPIRIAKEYIDEHFSENIDLNIVAKEAGLNPVYFSSLFKKETGINFKEYLLQKRVDTAKNLLVSSNDTIMAISERVGYKDVRYFSRVFSRTVGIKPNMYRKIYG